MHNLALVLAERGDEVTGSDDRIADPSKSRLAAAGLLPSEEGWDPGRISRDLDLVILGMHARRDNPELKRALELDLTIQSFPEFLYEETKCKRRVVIGGSHGKTTTTAMVLHVLRESGRSFDYMVGSRIEGFDLMVRLSEETDLAVFEGDEYPASALDPRPKLHVYRPHVAVLTGIAWDHINIYSDPDSYRHQFSTFLKTIVEGGTLIYNEEDEIVREVVEQAPSDLQLCPYSVHEYSTRHGTFYLERDAAEIALQVFGRHNMENVEAARMVCRQLGLSDDDFYGAIGSFSGAARRLQLLTDRKDASIYLDFAHAPSKVKATVRAARELYPGRRLVVCLELHTFSSLDVEFLNEYRGSLGPADRAIVFFDPAAVAHKNLPPLEEEAVFEAFDRDDLEIYTTRDELRSALEKDELRNSNLLMMSSGTFAGMNLQTLAEKLMASSQ